MDVIRGVTVSHVQTEEVLRLIIIFMLPLLSSLFCSVSLSADEKAGKLHALICFDKQAVTSYKIYVVNRILKYESEYQWYTSIIVLA